MAPQSCVFCGELLRWASKRTRGAGDETGGRGGRERRDDGSAGGKDETDPSSPNWNLFIKLKTLEAATGDFSDGHRLGQGGFGPVYKGVMPGGQQIAVKKLCLNSRQGLKEFTNEVRLLLKVQHRNLVSLLGCCAEEGEKMLVYEYLPNGSLDHVLFDKSKKASLNWERRFAIIRGIARGLLYLHEESPVRIIHRDIKASNILLDEQLFPKISDFGLARLFDGDDTHVNTFKIAGTYGYMAPEYALNGYLSVKADVFSFGILVLEIVSGRKNLDRRFSEEQVDLLYYAWNKSREGNELDIMDPNLTEWESDEATLCIRMGLLCCQASHSDRPDMNSVQLMLSTESFALPQPGKPGLRGRMARSSTTDGSLTAGMTMDSTGQSSTNTTMTAATVKGTRTSSAALGLAEEYSRNSISVSFTSEGR